jgi:hypothetical protein
MWHGEATDVPILTPEAQSRALKKIATPDEKLI